MFRNSEVFHDLLLRICEKINNYLFSHRFLTKKMYNLPIECLKNKNMYLQILFSIESSKSTNIFQKNEVIPQFCSKTCLNTYQKNIKVSVAVDSQTGHLDLESQINRNFLKFFNLIKKATRKSVKTLLLRFLHYCET